MKPRGFLMPFDINDPETKAAVEKLVADAAAAEAAKADGLKKNNAELLAEKKQLAALADKAKGMPEDFDPAEWEALRKEKAQREEDEARKKGEWEKLSQKQKEAHEAETKKLRDEAETNRKRYESSVTEAATTRAIAAADGIPEILMPKVMQSIRFKAGVDGGRDGVEVVNSDGSVRMGPGGTDMTVAELVTELRDDDVWARGFKGTGASGGGANGGGKSGDKTIKRADFEKLSPDERAKVFKDGKKLVD